MNRVPMKRFAGHRALVTGASRGIGARTAERLAAEGADVAIVARDTGPRSHLSGSLQDTEQLLASYGVSVATIAADLVDDRARAEVVPRAEEALGGPIDILVNNAAAAIYQPLAEFPIGRRRTVFEANVHAPLDLAQAVLPGMRARGRGWIVNVSSTTARLAPGPPFRLPEPGTAMAVYGASKAALNRITNGLAAELLPDQIRVNTVEPRFAVLTEGAEALVGDTLGEDQVETLDEMVESVVFLCSCPADFTGRVTVSLDLIQEQSLVVRSPEDYRGN